MGVYAQNDYDLTIPLDKVKAILDDIRQAEISTWTQDTGTADPKLLVNMIYEIHGNEGMGDAYFETDEHSLLITGTSSYGKVGWDLDKFDPILAKHGVTGTIAWECEGQLGLTVFKDGEAKDHGGEITYPTYESEELSAEQALRRIYDAMSGKEWSADTTEEIAGILGRTSLGVPKDPYDEDQILGTGGVSE